MDTYHWNAADEFLNRTQDLNRLESWWMSRDREPIAMLGRRRVGKSWLFRRFAHEKPAVIFVADELPPGTQLSRFADTLTPLLGFRPDLPDTQSLISVLFSLSRDHKLLAVIDEFPLLLGSSAVERQRTLSSIAAVMEEHRDDSLLKLILCGSHIATMESLFSETNPMHGRIQKFEIRPLSFQDAYPFLLNLDPISAFERYAITGGMPRYLARLGTGSLRNAITTGILNHDAALWDEGRSLLEQELREPRMYFAILMQLARGPKEINEIAQSIRSDSKQLSTYMQTLMDLRLVERMAALGSAPTSRGGQWQLTDPFLAFWFRFVFPHQADLEAGLPADALFNGEIADQLADHVSPIFESWCASWLRSHFSEHATNYGRWWGKAANEFRKTRERTSEEIDCVGMKQGRVTVVAETKWTTKKMDVGIVERLRKFKLPALRDNQLKVVEEPMIVLFAKSGYTQSLKRLADADDNIHLIDIHAALDHSAG